MRPSAVHTHPRERVYRKAQALDPAQLLAPAIGTIAVHALEECAWVMGEGGTDAVRQLDGLGRGPLRDDARVHHQVPVARIQMRQRPREQPREYGVAVGSVKSPERRL